MAAFTLGGATTTIAASTSTASGSIVMNQHRQILVTNGAAALAYIRSGIGAQTATAADTPIGAGAAQVFTIPANHDTVAVILASGTGNLYVTVGDGE